TVDAALSGACAAYLHGVAGGRCGPGASATTVLDALPGAFGELLGGDAVPDHPGTSADTF
ncbi:MAG TPA: hypothetical protein VIS06_09555, partial [Mycobacteriales bacterium]